MEQQKEFVRRIPRAKLELSHRGKLGCFPGDFSDEKVQKEEAGAERGLRIALSRPVSA